MHPKVVYAGTKRLRREAPQTAEETSVAVNRKSPRKSQRKSWVEFKYGNNLLRPVKSGQFWRDAPIGSHKQRVRN